MSGAGAADAATDPGSLVLKTGPTYSVAMTAYNAVPGQTDETPDVTASGAYSNPDIVAARSIDLADKLPYGTVIAIETGSSASPSCGIGAVSHLIGYRVIADSMNARMRNKVDLLFGTDDTVSVGGKKIGAARALGLCKDISIRVVGHVDIAKMPHSQAELALALDKNSNLAIAK